MPSCRQAALAGRFRARFLSPSSQPACRSPRCPCARSKTFHASAGGPIAVRIPRSAAPNLAAIFNCSEGEHASLTIRAASIDHHLIRSIHLDFGSIPRSRSLKSDAARDAVTSETSSLRRRTAVSETACRLRHEHGLGLIAPLASARRLFRDSSATSLLLLTPTSGENCERRAETVAIHLRIRRIHTTTRQVRKDRQAATSSSLIYPLDLQAIARSPMEMRLRET